jgi:hypothetical protein
MRADARNGLFERLVKLRLSKSTLSNVRIAGYRKDTIVQKRQCGIGECDEVALGQVENTKLFMDNLGCAASNSRGLRMA